MTEKDLINTSHDEAGKTEFQSGSKKGKKKKKLFDKIKTENNTMNKSQNKEAKTSFQGQSKEAKAKKKSHFKKEKMRYNGENGAGEARLKGHSKKGKKESLFDKETREKQCLKLDRKVTEDQPTKIVKKVKDKKVGKGERKNPDDSTRAADMKKALEMKAKIEEEKRKQNQTQGETDMNSKVLESSFKETPKESKKKKKKKRQKSSETGAVSMPGYDPPAGIVHEAIANLSHKRAFQDDDEDEIEGVKPAEKKRKSEEELDTPTQKTRRRFKPCHSKEEDNRTIFVGNLSLDVSEKELMKMFREFGEIESLRRRCIPVKNPDCIKRASFIKKEFHPERHNSICYIKFKTVEAAKKALVNNGKVINDLHIRVDIASSDSQDTEKTVFVANLPFDVEEEPLRGHFEDCGNIENVRIVRDRKTCLGKGIGYIKFTEKSSVYLALKLNGSTFQKRSLRVQRCDYNRSNDGKKRKSRDQSTPGPKQKRKFKQIPYDYDSDSSEEPVKIKKPKGTKSRQSEFFDEKEPVKVKKSKGTKNAQSAFIGEKAKRLKKLKKKSNFKSNMSVFFSTNNAPTRKRKSFDKIMNDNSERASNQESSVKHIRFGENDKSEKFKKQAGKKRDNQRTNAFENQTGKPFLKKKDIPGERSHKKFDDHVKDGGKQHNNTEKFSKKVPSDSSKGKHIHFD